MIQFAVSKKIKNIKFKQVFNSFEFSDEEDIKVLERFCGILSSRNLKINAVNFYIVDFNFLFGLAGALISYTVILTQMT